MKASEKNPMRDAFEAFARNERWGTCGYCPRDVDGRAIPEACEHTERYDHRLDLVSLVDQYTRRRVVREVPT